MTAEQIVNMRATGSKISSRVHQQQPSGLILNNHFNIEDETPINESHQDAHESTWHNQNPDDHQTADRAELAPDERKRLRLLAAFRLWRSKAEMQQNSPRQLTPGSMLGQVGTGRASSSTSGIRNSSSGGSGSSSSSSSSISSNLDLSASRVQRPSMQTSPSATNMNQVLFVPTCATTLPFAATVTPLDLNEAVSEKKLWQSLALPLVLGCTIFLIAIWTRQISLVLMSDTIVMVVILGGVFILMSGVAFWLAQDQKLDELSSASAEERDQRREHRLNCRRRYSLQNPHSHHHHHHLCVHLTGNEDAHQGDQSGRSHNSCGKQCCNISVIDCQPPDYYSAMRNSVPVNLYSTSGFSSNQDQRQFKQQHIVRFSRDLNVMNSLDNCELPLSSMNASLQPPSYEQAKQVATANTDYLT